MALFLRDEEIRQILTMDSMLEAIETMQRRYGSGEAYNLARRKIIASTGLLAVMGGGLFYDNVFGVKTYTAVAGKYSFHVTLYDATTGQFLAFLQANRLGQLRTGATTGVTVKYLARKETPVVGIIGTGYQASTQLEAVCRVRKVAKVKAYSRTEARRKEFAQTMTSQLGIEVVPTETNREAVEGSDILICIAATMTPVVQGEWLSPGTLVVAVGPTTWRAHEVDEATITRASRIVVDSLEQPASESGDLAAAVDKGLIQWSQLAELRHVVTGVMPGRQREDEIILAKIMGTGIADIAAAKLAYDTAITRGVGMEMEF